MKKSRVVYLPDLFEGRGENRQCDSVCVEHLQMIGLMVVMLMIYSRLVSVVYGCGLRDRRPNFAIFVVWSTSYVSAESLKHEGSISSSSFYEQLVDYYSPVFSLIHPVDAFSFKGMRTWGMSVQDFILLSM